MEQVAQVVVGQEAHLAAHPMQQLTRAVAAALFMQMPQQVLALAALVLSSSSAINKVRHE
jgi:hypothetical protein